MSTPIIGVRLADNSFYPIFSDLHQPSQKKMILTTARDGQDRAEINICRSSGDDQGREETLAMLALEDLEARNQGEPDIDLSLALDGNGKLAVVATERSTGNSRRLSVYVDESDYDDSYQVPSSLSDHELFEERETPAARRNKRSLTPLWIVLLLLLFSLLGWLFFRFAVRAGETQPEISAPAETAPVPTEPQPPLAESPPAPAPAAPAPADAPPPQEIPYHINWGDTLWDISERFYGTPWLFPEIADHNRIWNPDLIFAEDDIVIPGREYLER